MSRELGQVLDLNALDWSQVLSVITFRLICFGFRNQNGQVYGDKENWGNEPSNCVQGFEKRDKGDLFTRSYAYMCICI